VANYDLSIFNNEKVLDFIATVNEDSTPHITVFNSVLRYDDDTLMFGEYCRGLSKANILRDFKVAIFALSPQNQFVSATLTWKERRNAGPEHEFFNNIPRFRYNATYGYEWVHLLAIKSFSGPDTLSLSEIKTSGDRTEQIAAELPLDSGVKVLTYVGRSLFTPPEALRVLAYIEDDGYPRLIYTPQARLVGSNRVVLDAGLYSQELARIPEGAQVTIFSIVPKLASSITVKGSISRKKFGATNACVVDIERVYNGNTPKAGYIYPVPSVEAMRTFRGAVDV
jgi:hypothetical protein